jgi:hypothetical protein
MKSNPTISEKDLRKMAKKACDGNQHAMRYGNMLTSCFKMGQMVLEEIEHQTKDHLSEKDVLEFGNYCFEYGYYPDKQILSEWKSQQPIKIYCR